MRINIHPIIIVVFALFLSSCKRKAPDDEVASVLEELKEEESEKKIEPSEGKEIDALMQQIIAEKNPQLIISQLLKADKVYISNLVSAKDKGGKTLLHHLAIWKSERWGYEAYTAQAVKLLLAEGANPAAADLDGYTPLHDAASLCHGSLFLLLVASMSDESNRYQDINLGLLDKDGKTPFELAAASGALRILEFFIYNEVSPANYRGGKDDIHFNPTHLAAKNGHLAVLKLLHKNNLLCLGPDHSGNTPFYYALKEEKLKVVNFLSDIVNQTESVDWSLCIILQDKQKNAIKASLANTMLDKRLLTFVADSGSADAIQWLVEEIYDGDGKSKIRKMEIACSLLNIFKVEGELATQSLLEKLKDRGLNLAQPLADNSGSVLDVAFKLCIEQRLESQSNFFLEQIFTEPYEPSFFHTYTDLEGSTFLHHIVSLGYKSALQILCKRGPIPIINKKNHSGRTALMMAAECVPGMVEDLIEQGGRIEDLEGSTVLHVAAARGLAFTLPPKVVQRFANCKDREGRIPVMGVILDSRPKEFEKLTNGINLHVKDLEGNTLAHYAAMYNQPEILKYLHERGLATNETNNNGQTPLMLAAYRANAAAILQMVTDHPLRTLAEMSRLSPSGYAPIHYLAFHGDANIAKQLVPQLKDHKRILECYGLHNAPPLFLAVASGNRDMVEALLGAGAKPGAPNIFGETPLHIALENHHRYNHEDDSEVTKNFAHIINSFISKKRIYTSTSCFSTFNIMYNRLMPKTSYRYEHTGKDGFRPDICIKTVGGKFIASFTWERHKTCFYATYDRESELDCCVSWEVDTSETPPAIKKYFEDYAYDIVDQFNSDKKAIELIIILSEGDEEEDT